MSAHHPLRDEAIEVIRSHLATHGNSNWKPIFDRYEAKVHKATLWSWIRLVRQVDGEPIPKGHLNAAAAAIAGRTQGLVEQERVELMRRGHGEIAKDIPVAPSPNYIARSGQAGLANLDFVIELQNLYYDGQLLRQYAMKRVKDPETGEETEQIKNPVAFEKSIARRASILETALKAMGEIWDLRMQQQFYEAIIEEIGLAAPDVQKKILERLAALNARTGMTMSMRV